MIAIAITIVILLIAGYFIGREAKVTREKEEQDGPSPRKGGGKGEEGP